MSSSSRGPLTGAAIFRLIVLGLFAGFLSGMFGVGGGLIIVPGLMAVVGFTQKMASGTSLATIVPLASVGVISYATHGSVSWLGALLLAVGAMAGAQLGTWLLARIRVKLLRLVFIGFILAAIVSLFVVIPSRDAVLTITWVSAIELLVLGVITGTLSGLLGVGGGIIVVPALMLVFGASDLIAKGTSLLMMIPAAVVGTVSNSKRKMVDLRAAAIVGIPACGTTFLGSQTAGIVSPRLANILFAAFMLFIAIRMAVSLLKSPAGE